MSRRRHRADHHRTENHLADHRQDSSSNDIAPSARRGIPPHLWPPLIGLALLLIIVGVTFFWPGKRSADTTIGLRVRQVEQAAEFSYLELEDDGGETRWIAAPRVDVEVGDRVHFESAEPATNFPAPSLKRTFDHILLVNELFKVDADGRKVALRSQRGSDASMHGHGGMPGHGGMSGHGSSGHGSSPHGGGAPGPEVPIPVLERAAGGQTLTEILAEPKSFGGREVKLRGVVVSALPKTRVSFDAPPTNWYRLRDQAGDQDSLLFTADETLGRGDVVVVSGKLTLDRDFGAGMRYKMIIEGAHVIREQEASGARDTPAKSADPPTKPLDTKSPHSAEKSK